MVSRRRKAIGLALVIAGLVLEMWATFRLYRPLLPLDELELERARRRHPSWTSRGWRFHRPQSPHSRRRPYRPSYQSLNVEK